MSSKGTKKRKTWRCDVCQIAVFDTYDEALDHEQSCQGNTEADIDALASAVARGTASGAITNSGVEEEEEERGIGEAVFLAVTGGTTAAAKGNHLSLPSSSSNNNGGSLVLNGDGASPTVSTPTVLALLASSRAANGADAANCGGGSNVNNNGGAAVNPEIALPDVSADDGAAAVTATSNAAPPNNNNSQQLQPPPTCEVIAKEHKEDETEQQSTAPINNIETTPQPSPHPPLNTTTTNNTPPPKKRPRNKWRCDYCPAIFNEYDEAVIHETHCKQNKSAIITTPDNNNTTTPVAARLLTPNKGKLLLKTPWKCDYCPALFRSYDDALVHENECKLNLQQKGGIQSGVGVNQIGVPTTICIPTKVGLNETTEEEDGVAVVNKDAAPSAPASPPAAATSNINSNQKRLNWKCDVCLVAVFESYEEALAHENQCRGGELGRNMKKAKALESSMDAADDDVEQKLPGGEKIDVLEKEEDEEKEMEVGEKEVGEKEVVQQQQLPKVIQQQIPVRPVPQQQQQQQPQQEQEQLPKFQRSQIVQKETTVQKDGEQLPQEQPAEDNSEKKRKQPTAKESQPGLEKKRMEVRKEREKEAEKERAKKAKQEAAQKAKKAKEAEKQKARKAAKEAAEKQKAKKAATRDAAPKTVPVQGGSNNNVFLSLKDDFYRTHMFAYFRKLGALKQFQRDADEEKRIKEEAFLFFKNCGRKLVKYHDWKRPDLGYSEVDEEYARRSEFEVRCIMLCVDVCSNTFQPVAHSDLFNVSQKFLTTSEED